MNTISTVEEVVKPIGRPNMAYDFPIEVHRSEFDPKHLKKLIGQEVYVQCSEGPFEFISGKNHIITITDVSETKLYGKQKYKTEVTEIDLDILTLVSWSERIAKRIVISDRPQSIKE